MTALGECLKALHAVLRCLGWNRRCVTLKNELAILSCRSRAAVEGSWECQQKNTGRPFFLGEPERNAPDYRAVPRKAGWGAA